MSKINVPRPERRRQAAKTILLSLEMASTWRQRSAPQVITFIGTLVMMEMESVLIGEERIDSMENKMLNKYLPEPVHHVCSVGFGDDLASEEK